MLLRLLLGLVGLLTAECQSGGTAPATAAAPDASLPSPPLESPKLACRDDELFDCNRNDLDGCEANVLHHGFHCGACGISCDGGVCSNGQCGPAPELVAAEQDQPCSFATIGDTLYWLSCGGLFIGQLARDGVVSRLIDIERSGYSDLLSDGERLYFYSALGISRIGVNPPAAQPLIPLADVSGFAQDAEFFYWSRWLGEPSSNEPPGLWRTRKDGSGTELLATAQVAHVAVDEAAIYYTTAEKEVWFLRKQGGESGMLARTGSVVDLATRDGRVFWADHTGLWSSALGELAPERLDTGQVYKITFYASTLIYVRDRELVARSGQRQRTLGWVKTSGAVAVFAGYVYWADFADGTIWRVPMPPGL